MTIPKDVNRHPISGQLIGKYTGDDGFLHFVIHGVGYQYWDITQIPDVVYNKYAVGENITMTVRGHQYRYMGDVI